MLVTEILQLPQSFNIIESVLFDENESNEIINIYNNMYNDNLTRTEKIRDIQKVMNKMANCYTRNEKKFYCLIIFSILNTPFGYQIIQDNDKFRETVFSKYKEFIDMDDLEFTEALRSRKI
jgi:hypothetical protein